jgi:hypothetical protein
VEREKRGKSERKEKRQQKKEIKVKRACKCKRGKNKAKGCMTSKILMHLRSGKNIIFERGAIVFGLINFHAPWSI